MVTSRLEKRPKVRVVVFTLRSNKGSTKSFETIIANAMVDTITIPLAADVPPTNASNAMYSAPTDNGTLITKLSLTPPESRACPAHEIGKTNNPINNK